MVEVVLPDKPDQVRIILFKTDRTVDQFRKVDLKIIMA